MDFPKGSVKILDSSIIGILIKNSRKSKSVQYKSGYNRIYAVPFHVIQTGFYLFYLFSASFAMVVVGVMGSLERTFRMKLSSGESCSGTESCLGEYSMTGFPRYDFISLIFFFKSSSVPEKCGHSSMTE